MKSIIIYDSLYGNTEKIAQAIGDSLAEGGFFYRHHTLRTYIVEE